MPVDRKHARVPPAASQPLITKFSRLWAVTKYSYDIFSSRNSRFLFRVAHSRCCVNFLASSRSHPLNETLRRARIPDRDLGARLRRPPWVRSFCRRASSRACGSRYAPPQGVRRARPPRQPARIRFRFRHSPLTEPRPVHAQLRDATITPETRDDDRAHLKALSDARAGRWPNTLEVRNRRAALVATDPRIPIWTRRDETRRKEHPAATNDATNDAFGVSAPNEPR